jgi:hypothetical protein
MAYLTSENRLRMIKFLRHLANGGEPLDHSEGLCGNLRKKFGVDLDRLFSCYTNVMNKYDRFSGDYPFPVTNGWFFSPKEAFDNASANNTMFKGVYGQERRRLAAYLANEAEKELVEGK